MDTLTAAERSERMRRIRSKDTGPEMIVRRLVHGMGFRYRLHDRTLPGAPDLVFKNKRKVILVHGCFWHFHRVCHQVRLPKSRIEFWKTKFEENRRRDGLNRRKLRAQGWEVLVIWECQTKRAEELARQIRRFLEGRPE